jgi:dolichol-phosphate mannosyltransferase
MGMAWVALLALTWRMLSIDDERLSTWLVAGLVLGFGLLSKYTILLLAASLVLFLVSDHSLRRHLLAKRFWLAVVVAVMCCLPIIIWNAELGWPTVKYHLHDRQSGGGGANFSRWGQFWGSQAIALGPALFLLCLATWVVALKRWHERRWRFILLMTLPTFLLFCVQALFAEFKPHWPAPAYSLVFIGVGELAREGFGFCTERGKNLARGTIGALVLLIFIPLNVLFYVGSIWPIIPKVAHFVAPHAEWDIKFDPTNDLYGWDAVAARVVEIRGEFARNGQPPPFLSSSRYQLTSQLAFATGEVVWRVSPDKDQYMFWQSREKWQPLVGQNALYITDNRYTRDPRSDFIFKSCAEDPAVLVYRGDELAREFHIWRCREFIGLR